MRTLISALKAILVPAPKAIPAIAAPTAPAPSFAQELALLRAYDSHHIAVLEKEVANLRKENTNLARANKRTTARMEEAEEALSHASTMAIDQKRELEKAALSVNLAQLQAHNGHQLANNHAATINDLQEKLAWQERMTDEAAGFAVEGLRLLDIAGRKAEIMANLYESAKTRISSRFSLPVVATEVTAQETLYLAIRQVEIDAELETFAPVGRKVVGFGKADLEGNFHCRQCRRVESRRGHRHGSSTPSPREVYHYLNR
jgi:hypothetical protein